MTCRARRTAAAAHRRGDHHLHFYGDSAARASSLSARRAWHKERAGITLIATFSARACGISWYVATYISLFEHLSAAEPPRRASPTLYGTLMRHPRTHRAGHRIYRGSHSSTAPACAALQTKPAAPRAAALIPTHPTLHLHTAHRAAPAGRRLPCLSAPSPSRISVKAAW